MEWGRSGHAEALGQAQGDSRWGWGRRPGSAGPSGTSRMSLTGALVAAGMQTCWVEPQQESVTADGLAEHRTHRQGRALPTSHPRRPPAALRDRGSKATDLIKPPPTPDSVSCCVWPPRPHDPAAPCHPGGPMHAARRREWEEVPGGMGGRAAKAGSPILSEGFTGL